MAMGFEDMPHESEWVGRPFPQWNRGCPHPQWNQGPPGPRWRYPTPQWDNFNPQRGQGHHNFQRYPVPRWNQSHLEPQSRDFHNDNFLRRGSGSYGRCSQGRFYGNGSSCHFFEDQKSYNYSLRFLVELTKKKKCPKVKKSESATSKTEQEVSVASLKNSVPRQKKKHDTEVEKSESATPKETEQEDSVASLKNSDPLQKKRNYTKVKKSESATSKETEQEDSVASLKNSDPPQDSQEASKAIITPSQFSFRLSPNSLKGLMSTPAKQEHTELEKKKFTKVKKSESATSKDTEQEDSVASLINSDLPQVKMRTCPKTEDSHKMENDTQEATSKLHGTLENLELKKEEKEIELDKLSGRQATEAQPSQATSLPSAETPMDGQAPSHTRGGFQPVGKEESVPVHLGVCQRTQVHRSLATTPLSAEAPAAKQALSETTKDSCPVMKEQPLSLESNQHTDHFNQVDSSQAAEIPFLSESTDESQAKGKEDLEPTQMGGLREDTCRQRCDAVGAGSSAVPVAPTNASSVPVLVSRKHTVQPYFWEFESVLHAQDFNWNDRGWAPEDYQEPTWGIDEAKIYDDISESDRHSVLSHLSSHSHHTCDRIPSTEEVLKCHSSSQKSHPNNDSKHSGTRKATQDLHFRCGSPLRQSRSSRSPLRGRENSLWTDGCNKCHCKHHQNPPQERIPKRDPPFSYSTHERHRHHPSREGCNPSSASHSFSSYNSTTKRKIKSACCKKTLKVKSSSVKGAKSSKIKKPRKVRARVNHDAALLTVETSISSETTGNFQPTNTRKSESVQLATSSEDEGFPHQPCAGKECGPSASSRIMEDPRSVAVLTRRNQIEQDYLQIVLNLATVATMLLQKEPSMEKALEVALRANVRSIGDYYESMLKDFIDDYDLS